MDIGKLILAYYVSHSLNFIGNIQNQGLLHLFVLGMARQNEQTKGTKT